MSAISVILPVYNGMPYLQEAVTSVLQQEFTDFEFLILDDCSTDNSWQYLQSITDKRVTLLRNDVNKGLFPNLNLLVQKSTAPLVKLWSQDDVMYPNCLSEIVNFHTQHPAIGFSYTGRDFIDENSLRTHVHENDITPDIVSKELHAAIACFTGSIAGNIANVTITREAFNNCGLFNDRMKISGDFEMWVRISLRFPIGFIRKTLVRLRNHSGQLSRQEQYYIYHLKEDITAYRILMEALTEQQIVKAKKMLRTYKLMFYYTLMLKAFLKGNFHSALNFFRTLSSFDNIFILSVYYFRQKIAGRPRFEMRPL